jgi:hypothetical protein
MEDRVMKRWILALSAIAVAALGVVTVPAQAGTSVSIQVGDSYSGGSIVFRSEPDVVLVPATKVYYVRDYDSDLYRYGRYWYFVEGGYWYRARSWRGPFVHVHVNSVPRSVRTVPVNYRRNWNGPPPHAMARGYDKGDDHPGYQNGQGHKKHKR